MKEKYLPRLERRVSSFRTTVFKHRKAAAKRKKYFFFSLCLGGKENSIMSLNGSAKKKQEKNYEPGVMDCVGML